MRRSPEDEFYRSLLHTFYLVLIILSIIIVGSKLDNYLIREGYMSWL